MRSLFFVLALAALPALAARPFAGGAIAAAHPLASAAGKEVLDAGGNAVDAAVAAAFTMAVVGPYHSGLGGGGFAIAHVGGADVAFDFREVAPKKASRDMFIVDGRFVQKLSTDGALAVAVPGAVKGYLELHAKYGKLPRAKVLAPAIRAATNGFTVTPRYRDIALQRESCLANNAEAARIFLRAGADGVPLAPPLGTVIKQPDLAKTLQAIAAKGEAAFYSGAIARSIAETVQREGGVLTVDDLAAYKTAWRAPLEGSYRGHRVVTMPPPSAGGLAVVQVLGMLEAKKVAGPASREVGALHTFIEALRLAYVDRAKFLGDPDSVEIPLAKLTSPAYLGELAARIDPKKATRSATLTPVELRGAAPTPDAGSKNTTHISVIDRDGNAVALTTTINFYFGSCLVAPGTGVLLNDEMDDFAAQPGTPNIFGLVTGESNSVAPGRRPLSSMSPTLLFMKDRPKDVLLAVGSPGGSTIPTTVLQAISNVVDGRLDVARTVGLGRIHHQWLPDEVWVDKPGIDPATQAALEAMGHTFKRVDAWGDAQAVMVDPVTGLRTAGSDPRWEGAGVGQD